MASGCFLLYFGGGGVRRTPLFYLVAATEKRFAMIHWFGTVATGKNYIEAYVNKCGVDTARNIDE